MKRNHSGAKAVSARQHAATAASPTAPTAHSAAPPLRTVKALYAADYPAAVPAANVEMSAASTAPPVNAV